MQTFIPTNEKVTVENYPYGFTAKTTLFDYVEFVPKKGYRHCTQTVNPKTGSLNAPKKSTYYPLLVRYYNEMGHIKSVVFDFNGDEAINKGCRFVAENFTVFTPDEIKYLYAFAQMMANADFKATCIYGGSTPAELAPFYSDFRKNCKVGYDTGVNVFPLLILDNAGIEATKPKNYNPFRTYYEPTTL